MAKSEAAPVCRYRCRGCSYSSDTSWYPYACPSCRRMFNIVSPRGSSSQATKLSSFAEAQKVKKVPRIHTGFRELNDVLGGGIAPGSAILATGEPGSGKSTLWSQVADRVAVKGNTVLYASSEQEAFELHEYAQRLGLANQSVKVFAKVQDVDQIVAQGEVLKPRLLIVDSVNRLYSPYVDGALGSPQQMIACGEVLKTFCKKHKTALVLICQQSRQGNMLGPRGLEHDIDVVVHFDAWLSFHGEGETWEEKVGYTHEQHVNLRVLRSEKNRYGSSDRRILMMSKKGLCSAPAPKLPGKDDEDEPEDEPEERPREKADGKPKSKWYTKLAKERSA